LALANGKLYIADTNNHAIRVVDLSTKNVSTLRLKGLEPPASATKMNDSEAGPNSEEIKLAPQGLRPNSKGLLTINLELPAGYHLNPLAPQRYRVSIESGAKQLGLGSDSSNGATYREQAVSNSGKHLKLPLQVPFQSFDPGAAELRVQFSFVYCREDNTGMCRIKTLVWRAPVEVSKDPSAPSELKVSSKVTAE
jgi:hypothetical protein